MLRSLMLRMADSPSLVGFISRQGMRTGFARRFVAGEDLDEAVKAVVELNSCGIRASLDLLGEGVTHQKAAASATQGYLALLERIAQAGVDSNISIKLTQLGLDIDRQVCAANLRRILDRARKLDNFVRIDMEGSAYTQASIELFREHLDIYGPRHVGIVIQAYLYRSEKDLEELSQTGCNIRLCKGAYKEPAEIAFPKKADVDANYVSLLKIMLSSPCFSAIATHDDKMIDQALEFIRDNNVDDSRYEFQMLYGTRREYQMEINRKGYAMRVYVPFGNQWAPYFMRRLAERPANLFFVLKNLLRR